jgi:hypothetical protein
MWETVKTGAISFHRSFHQSGVIWFARVQVFLGMVFGVLTTIDLSPIITDQKYLTLWLIGSGLITEMSRRSNTYEDDDGHLMPRRQDQDQEVNITVNNAAAPAPASPLGPTSASSK